MKNEERLNLFDLALARLQAGEKLDLVLNSMPLDSDLIEMVRAASLILIPEGIIQEPDPRAQQQSKQKFFQAALSLETGPQKHNILGWLQGLRLVSQLALAAIVLVFSLTITGIVSAQALPGQPLYGVKRLVEQTQLALTRDSLGRLQLEEVLDARRINEVLRLQKSERWQLVQFAGWMQQSPDGSWQVQGIPVMLDEQSPLWNPMLNGAYVEVTGILDPAGVIIRQIELRLFKLHGVLKYEETETWQVNGVPLMVSPQTQTQGLLTNGLLVDVTAIRLNNDQYLALVINIASNNTAQESTSQINSTPLVATTVTEEVLASETVRTTATFTAANLPSATADAEDEQELSETADPRIERTDADHESGNKTPGSDEPDEPDDHEATEDPDDD